MKRYGAGLVLVALAAAACSQYAARQAGGGGQRTDTSAVDLSRVTAEAPRLAYDMVAGSDSGAGGGAGVARNLATADEVVVLERDAAAPPAGIPRAPTQGALRARNATGDEVGEFPLEHTEVSADVAGYLARTEVEQRYRNTFDQAIEAVYVFPMPSLAAVHDFVMEANGRKIVGVVRPRAEAQQIYEQARSRGQTASLLTQERPNIFTQNVANIAPGGTVTIRITYVERLAYGHGEYEYIFPMVVGTRYQSGSTTVAAALAGGSRRGGLASVEPRAQSARAEGGRANPDAGVPVLPPGVRNGHDIGLTVHLDAGLPITKLRSVAHRVDVDDESAGRRVIHLAASDSIPNRDFVLRWSVAGAETQFGVLAHRSDTSAFGPGYFTLTMQPPAAPRDEQVMPREITFIMDVSGSMMGTPLELSKALVRRTLARLRPEDRFNIVYFASGNAQLWDRPRPGTGANVAAAKAFLEDVSAGGGTEMMAGLRRAMGARHDPEFLQMYVFLTDGFVSEDREILRTVTTERGDARFFGFGIGSSVNRYLIDGIGEHGGGTSVVLMPRDPRAVERAAVQLFEAIDSPVLVDAAIDWNGLPVRDVYPAKLPDLFAGQTLSLVGRYSRPARGTAYVTGRVGSRRVRVPLEIDFPEEEPRHAALAPTWARFRIHELETQMLAGDAARRTELTQEITDLAVRHHLVSEFTSFVAVDESRIVGNGRPARILQPVALPEGVSYEGIFGERPAGPPARIGAWGVTVQGTERGAVRVGEVRSGSLAERLGMTPGAVIRAINGALIHTLDELEAALLQATGSIRVSLGSGREVTIDAP